VTVTPAGNLVVAHGRAVLKVLENAEAQLAELARRERARRTGAGPAPGLSPAT
jgi:DNA-binding transcriptional LysR family regulator